MKIKMLTGLAGADFALSVGDVTDRFSEAEAGRLVAADYAVEVTGGEFEPPGEWGDEKQRLLSEIERLKVIESEFAATAEAFATEKATLVAQLAESGEALTIAKSELAAAQEKAAAKSAKTGDQQGSS